MLLSQQNCGSSVQRSSSRPVFICLKAPTLPFRIVRARNKQHPRARKSDANGAIAFLRLSYWRASDVSLAAAGIVDSERAPNNAAWAMLRRRDIATRRVIVSPWTASKPLGRVTHRTTRNDCCDACLSLATPSAKTKSARESRERRG